jgi:hypothetical protein
MCIPTTRIRRGPEPLRAYHHCATFLGRQLISYRLGNLGAINHWQTQVARLPEAVLAFEFIIMCEQVETLADP